MKIGSSHDIFANYIFGKYRRVSEYAYSGVTLTFLQPKQDEEIKESSVHIAYRLMLQELYFLTHNTIIVNQKEILQGITASVERQLELVRKENRAEAMRMESLIRQIRETKDNEQLLRIEYEIENKLGINIISKSERKSRTDDQATDQTPKVTNLHNAVIDRYFERLQSAILLKTSIQTNGANAQESVLEQQRKLLGEVYAESTKQEKWEFASYLVEKKLLYKLEDKAVKELKIEKDNYIVQDSNIVRKVMNDLEANLTKEITEQITSKFNANLTKEITEQAANELEANLTKEIKKEITEQVTVEIENDQVNKTENKIQNKIDKINENVVESEVVRYQGKNQTHQEHEEQSFEQAVRITDTAFLDAVKNKVERVSEMLQTVNEMQFRELQQVFMETYEKQQLSRLAETEEQQFNIETGLTHIQKNLHNTVIDRYFAQLQSAIISKVSLQTKEENAQETVFEQQRNLLSRIYAESTEQEKEEFASYLEESHLLYKKEDKAIKGRKAHKTENVFESEVVNYRDKKQISIEEAEQTSGKMIPITDNAFAEAIKNKVARVSEILQTISETQFQELQQVFMESYEKQLLSRLAETEELQLNIGTGLTHIQKSLHSAVIDRYFEKLRSAMISEASMLTKKANVQDTVFEQQRNLLSRVYAESTEQEKEEFASYLEERHLLYKTEQKAVKERKIDQDSNIIHEVMNQLETNLTKEITEQVTKELDMNQTKGKTVQVTSEIEKSQISKEYAEQTHNKVIRITDNELADVLKNKVQKVSEMLQTINETQFQELQQVFMEAYERRRLSQLVEIGENQIGIETGLTHIQNKLHNPIIERYFEGLQSMLVSESVRTNKTKSQQAMFALQRTLLSRVYEESTEQEREEFVSYLEEKSLIYKIEDRTGKDDKTRLADEMSDQIKREIETRLSHKITNRTSDHVIGEFETNLTRKAEKYLFRERTNLHHFIINRYLNRLQSMLMSGSVQTEKTSTQEIFFNLHRNILNRVYSESTEQEKKEFVSGIELSYLVAKKKREDGQESETKIQEIVERCMKHTTRITESENVRRQINDQKNEIVQLKTQVQRQQEEMSELVRKSSRVLNMDRMYQEIEKRMESRLHLERLRRGM